MPLLFHKLLPAPLLPIGLVLLLLILAWWTRRRWVLATAAVTLYLFAIPIVSDTLLATLENRFPASDLAECPPADAVVVLGGVTGESHSLRGTPEWNSAVDRFEQGIRLLAAGKAPLLVFSGGRIPWENQPESEGAVLRRAAIEHGIPEKAVLVTADVENTSGEAEALAALSRDRGLRRVLLVTSAFHMPRAVILFRTAGVSVIPFPVDYRTRFRSPLTVLDFLPQAAGIEKSEIALREYYGLAYYRLRGRR